MGITHKGNTLLIGVSLTYKCDGLLIGCVRLLYYVFKITPIGGHSVNVGGAFGYIECAAFSFGYNLYLLNMVKPMQV